MTGHSSVTIALKTSKMRFSFALVPLSALVLAASTFAQDNYYDGNIYFYNYPCENSESSSNTVLGIPVPDKNKSTGCTNVTDTAESVWESTLGFSSPGCEFAVFNNMDCSGSPGMMETEVCYNAAYGAKTPPYWYTFTYTCS